MDQPIKKRLHKTDPYEGFDTTEFTLDVQGWEGDSPVLSEIVEELQPQRIVEVGTWLGQSALTMACAAQESTHPCEIVCVDTWLGSAEFWTDHADPLRYERLNLVNGYPSVYRQFMANVLLSGFEHVITPMPVPSSIAAELFRKWGETTEVCYIDASHENNAVLRDLASWAPLTTKLLFGHDWLSWSSVQKAVKFYLEMPGTPPCRFETRGNFWLIHFIDD